MPIDLDELAPRKKQPDIVIGEDLSSRSVFELEARVAALEAEVVRTKEAIAAKSATKSAADAFFKR